MKWNGEYLFKNVRNDNKYKDMEDGKGSHGGGDNGGESDNDSHNVIHRPSFGGMGHRTLIVGPYAAAAVINDNDNNNRRRSGGALCPPPSNPSRPAGCRLLLSMSPTAVDGGGMGVFGVCSYVWWRRRRSAPLYLFVRFQSTPGWTMGGRGAA
jgi:hypothetical protein